MIQRIIEILKDNSIKFAVILYLFLGLSAWVGNGLFGTHFVIKDLTDIFMFVFTQLTAQHGIDSIFNSPKGVKP